VGGKGHGGGGGGREEGKQPVGQAKQRVVRTEAGGGGLGEHPEDKGGKLVGLGGGGVISIWHF